MVVIASAGDNSEKETKEKPKTKYLLSNVWSHQRYWETFIPPAPDLEHSNVKICHLPPEIGAQLFPTNLGLSMSPMYIRWRWAQFNVTITILLHWGNGILSSKMLEGQYIYSREVIVRFTKYLYKFVRIYYILMCFAEKIKNISMYFYEKSGSLSLARKCLFRLRSQS